MRQHTTPHSTTGVPPCQLLMGRMIKTPLSAVFTSVQTKVLAKQTTMKNWFEQRATPRSFNVGDNEFSRNDGQGPKYTPGTVMDKLGPVTCEVLLEDNRYAKRHTNQLFSRSPECQSDRQEGDFSELSSAEVALSEQESTNEILSQDAANSREQVQNAALSSMYPKST